MRKLVIVALITLFLGLIIYGYRGYNESSIVSKTVFLPPSISAKNAILIDADNGELLYQKDKDEKAYPASTTKILTGLVALELCQQYGIDLDTEVKIPKEAAGVEGSSLYLEAGEKNTIRELLYGTMLRSGNDGATALSIILGGNLDNFVKLMNEKADKLGCTGSHFVNPTGLHDDNHYTTAGDLSKIAAAAMKNKEFRRIVGVKNWGSFSNKNKTIYQYKGATGVKIGFTEVAGRTLVASAKRDGCELIAVVLSDGNWFQDAYDLLDYGFSLRGITSEN